MKTIHLLGILLLIGILVLGYVKIMGEGFSSEQKEHDEFSLKYQQKYNRVGNALVASNNEKALGKETGGLFGNVQDTMDSNGKLVQKIDNPYPLEGGRSGMFAIIDKCEARNTVDCSAFDDPKFTQDCGMCLEIGSNSQGNPQTGGLVLTSKDKTYAQSQKQGNFLAAYSPTVGMCPKGKMVATKAECLKLKAELDCQKSGAFNKPPGCAQCYNDGEYHVVDGTLESGLIQGYGVLMVIGSGTLSWSESGQSNTGSIDLSSTAKPIPILGGENNPLTLTLAAPIVATPYSDSKTYEVNDHIIFNNGIFTMQEGAGAPGYNPSRPGDKLWKLDKSYANYRVPEAAYLAGYLKPSNGTSGPMDLYRLILTDSVTGRKPRISGQSKVNEIDVTNMVPGFGQKTMGLTARSPFTYIDELSEEASLCPNSPFITKSESASLLGSDPCYEKGSGPGKYNAECLQKIFQNNGCGLNPMTISKSGYPSNQAKANLLQFNNNGRPLELNKIADIIYSNAVMTSTGVDSNGNQLTLEELSIASLFCNGVAINSPCQALDRNGKLSTECIVYLWDNQGANKIPGATYNFSSLAKSLFPTGTTDRFCTRSGTLAPKDLNNKENPTALAYWKGLGSEAAVKAAMSQLHLDANSKLIKEDDRLGLIKQCYGITIGKPQAYSATYVPDVSEEGFTNVKRELTKVTSAPSNTEKWRKFACSSDGSFIIGVYWNGISISRDKGKSWSNESGPSMHEPYKPDSLYFNVACSADGTKVIIGTTNGGPLWLSTNSCGSWTKVPDIGGSIYVACSSDGLTMYAVCEGWYSFVSRNSGTTWTRMNTPPWQTPWRNIACSSTGQYAIMVEYNGKVAVTNNFGQSWAIQTSNVLNTNAWSGATCSADGSQMAIYNQHGQLYKTVNSGSSWTKIDIRPPSGFNGGMDLSSSGDGRIIALTHWPGGLSISSDGGKKWTFLTPSPPIHGYTTVSSDGSMIIVGDYYGKGEMYSYIPPEAAAPRSGVGWSL